MMAEIPRKTELDAIEAMTGALYSLLSGRTVSPIVVPPELAGSELGQLLLYFNRFSADYSAFEEFLFTLSRGDLDGESPAGGLGPLQSAKNLQANLRHLTYKTRRIAGGDFSQKVDFMGDFSEAFNKMTDDLFTAFERIRQQNAELVKLSLMKDEFLAIASHDMRSPFTAILGFSQLLLSAGELSGRSLEFVECIKHSAETQLRYVNDLLDALMFGSGGLKLSKSLTTVEKIVGASVDALSVLASNKGVRLVVSNLTGRERNEIELDEPKIVQAVNNLVSNAIKFTPSGGSVTVEYSAPPSGGVEIHVRDSGIGIPSGCVEKLFTRFDRFQRPGTSGERGSGLGLSITRGLVESHGGSIGAKSEPGNGSDFFFTLPAGATGAASANSISSNENSGLPSRRVRVLVAEDNPQVLKLVERIVKMNLQRAEVVSATDGARAVELVFETSPDIVFLDIDMPLLDGYQAASEIRRREAGTPARVPIVALSAYDRAEVMKKGPAAGIDASVSKPLSVKEIMSVISRLVPPAE